MKRYEEYKDSGIEWIGEIPRDWKKYRFKDLYRFINGNGFPEKFQGDSSGEYPFLKVSDINANGKTVSVSNNYVSKELIEENNWNIISKNSLLTAKIGVALIKNHRKINSMDCIIDNNMLAIIPNEYIDNDYSYFLWLLVNMVWYDNSGTIPSINSRYLANQEVYIPDFGIQKSIAYYLDKKALQIDSLTSDKEKLIGLLKEERQAIISEAVTKGLDKNVKMKDSGVEWIGKIPEHWEVKKLRYIGYCQNGISKSGEHFGSGYPFVSYGDVYKNMSLPEQIKGLVESNDKEREIYSVEKGDVFFTRTSETIEEIAIASTCLETITDATFAGFLIRFRPYNLKLIPDFEKYYFRCKLHRNYFVRGMNLVTRASLGQELLKNLLVIIPPMEEQKEIASHLDRKISQIDSLISDINSQIEKLKEYRQSIISEAVTGKVKI